MPPARRPSRPGRQPARPAPPAGGGKKPPVLLFAGIGGGALLLIIILAVAFSSGGGGPAAPAAPTRPRKDALPKPAEAPATTVRLYQVDTGSSRVVTVLVGGKGRKSPADIMLVDDAGKKYTASPAEAREHFLRELKEDPGATAVSFRAPASAGSLDLVLPGGKTEPIYRPPGPRELPTLPATAKSEGWTLKASGSMKDGGFELELQPTRAAATPRPLRPERIYALTDGGNMLSPRVLSRDPIRLRYEGLPSATKEIRIQIGFRAPKPAYFVFKVGGGGARVASGAKPAAPKPAAPVPEKPDVKKLFEARRSDIIGALKFLGTQPVDQARPIARETVAMTISQDLVAGMKALTDGDAAAAEKRLTRAALLASPYQPEFSRQLMRMIFLSGKPRRTLTGCAACSGAGARACKACTAGRTEGACPRCESKGKVDCLVCEGAGNLDHFGYRGRIEIQITRPYKFRMQYQGKMRSFTMHRQTITYTVQPCSGRGSFHQSWDSINTETGKNSPGSKQQTCEKFWEELKKNVFNGKAKLRIPDRSGNLVKFSSISARRFFTDFEKCESGHVTCDRCLGKKRNTCTVCTGKGKSEVMCSVCEGTTLRLCDTCSGYGDSSWLKKILPAAPALSQALGGQAMALRGWLDARARIAANKTQIAVRLKEARKGLDPTAKLTADLVEIKCTRCKGNSRTCLDCWATGRREYPAGTTTYARYALAGRLERRMKNVDKAAADRPDLKPLSVREASAATARTPAAPAAVPPRPKFREVAIPATVEEMIATADGLFQKGLGHLKKSKGSQDNSTWINEGHLALEALRNAQTLYATAQETLDAKGLTVPRTLLKKFRTNMQALVMARKQLP